MKIAILVIAATILVPTASLRPQTPQRDVPAEVDSARNALKGALNDLEHAGSHWGGHRDNAMTHIREAMAELNEAEKWAHEHHDVK